MPRDDATLADILLISDTHASDPMAPHQLWSDGDYADRYFSPVAIRPPHVDQWGSRVLDWVLDQRRDTRAIIHLGDAGNIGCVSEFSRFSALMKRHREAGDLRSWYMAPGNHDSLVLGNWAYIASPPKVQVALNRECEGTAIAGGTDKHKFITEYIAAKDWDEAASQVDPDRTYTCNDVITHDRAAVARICRRTSEYQYDSFLLQAIAIRPDLTLILLDTTQFRALPNWRHPGGKTGGIGLRQLAELRGWLKQRPGQRILLAGHHPIRSLDDASQRDLAQLIHDFSIVAYLSGHLHNSTTAREHEMPTASDSKLLELNVGSVIDEPMEYAVLSADALPGPVATTELALTVAAISEQLADACAHSWGGTHVRSGQHGYYVNYVGRNAYGLLRNQMFQHLQADVATPEEVMPADYAARELAHGETPIELLGDTGQAHRITEYERCQAVWASAAEAATTLSRWNRWIRTVIGWFKRAPAPIPTQLIRADGEAVATERWRIPHRE